MSHRFKSVGDEKQSYLISTSCKSTNSPFFFFLSTSILSSLRLRLSAMKRRKNTLGMATPRAMQMMASEALIRLFIPTVTSPTTPCMSMKERYRRCFSPRHLGQG